MADASEVKAAPPPNDLRAASCSATHCLALEVSTRRVVSWTTRSSGNRFGQLGRGKYRPAAVPATVDVGAAHRVVGVSAGGGKDAGHSAVVTEAGEVFTWGCDRWQQLGLGSPDAGAVGYTWEKGRIWQPVARRVRVCNIAQVACGADHTVLHGRRRAR